MKHALVHELRSELASIASPYENWDEVEAWLAKARPAVRRFFPDDVADFDSISSVRWITFPRVVFHNARQKSDALNAEAGEAERIENTRLASGVKTRLLAYLDTLLSMTATGKETHQTMNKIKALFLTANPKGTSKLNLDDEIREITSKVRASEHRDVIELISRWAVRPDDLLQYLNEDKPHIVHFSGHGTQSDEIVLLDNKRKPKTVSKDWSFAN